MTIRDIFVPLTQAINFDPQFDAAARLAAKLNAQVNIVFTRPNAVMAAAGVPDMPAAAGVFGEAVEHESGLAETSAMTQFERWRTANGLVGATKTQASSHVGAVWHERIGLVTDTIVEIGRVSDLIVIGRPDPYQLVTEEIFTASIYSTSSPTMIVPDRLADDDPLEHVLIAWNGSVEAARAVAGAMPMLEAAKRVSLFSMPQNRKANHPGLIAHLERHDIHAEWVHPNSWSSDIGLLLIKAVADEKASMIVMGAYTHHRMREALLGGVTHHVLKYCEVPVVMMH
jgi:nucleotide-binding universal stress UspA family protein